MGKDDSSQILGIIFPLLPQHAERFLNQGKTVFVKFFGKERIPVRLQSGSRLFLYESRGNEEIVGEARIVRIDMLPVSEIVAVYGNRLFLTQSEFEDYVGNRRDKRMLVLVLEDARKYPVALKLGKSVTMAGRYMTRELYHQISRIKVANQR
ncbi:MAG: DUF365 domain-containing protein [Candidatus Bathyarchaeia archaeon]